MSQPVIIDAVRTPIGTAGGSLRGVGVDQLVTPLLRTLAERCPDREAISEVFLGNIRGPGGNLARYCTLEAGLPQSVPGVTIDLQCGSGLAAVEAAYYVLRSRPGYALAGGAQSASTQPRTFWGSQGETPGEEFHRAPFAPTRFGDPDTGVAADLLAELRGVTRDRQDAYAARSHARAVASQEAGVFDAEIVPIAGVSRDERPRAGFGVTRMARFHPAFRDGGTVTAANSCGVNDGGAMLLLCDAHTHAQLDVAGLRILGVTTVGCDPALPGWGIVPAVQAVLAHTGVELNQLDAIEFNEAFAGQVLACLDGLGIDEERNCAQGGALALGHPWAASGAVLVTRLFSQLVRQDRGTYGLAAIAVAGGMGSAIVVERC